MVFFAFVSGWCFLVLFCLCFSFYCVALFSRKLPEKILFLSGARFGRNFRERIFGFFAFVSGCCFLVLFFQCFSFILLPCSPRKLPENILFLSGAHFGRNFRQRTFWFLAFVSGWCFWCCFAYVSALLCCLVLPKAGLKKILFLSGARFGRNFRERILFF